jgi:predicted mannosyl-3-phosphoglycerate phosphatase (HAD superfamily)
MFDSSIISEDVRWLMVTDLDDTLLNHQSYAYDTSLNAITNLQDNNIPVILNTSKTYDETIEFSEPLIWKTDEASLSVFQQQLETHGLTTLQGGRFSHVIGDCDKGVASTRLIEYYDTSVKPINTRVIALGDSANDAAMLNVADISIIVNPPSNHQLSKIISADIRTEAAAPEGWREAISTV